MVKNHYRWDFIGLSTDTKPTPETSEKVADGSTFYESDTSKYYVWCQDDWYEKTSTGGGGGGGAVNTVNNVSPDSSGNVELTPSDIGAQAALTAGSNITIDDGTISATDTTYSNFVGTDGTAAGTMGLVPAPATTDAGKFLKADGTWGEAGSAPIQSISVNGTAVTPDANKNVDLTIEGGVKTLTKADYDYPTTGEKTSINGAKLEPGVYINGDTTSITIRTRTGTGPAFFSLASGGICIKDTNSRELSAYAPPMIYFDTGLLTVSKTGYQGNSSRILDLSYIKNDLTTVSTGQVLDAYQGKVLKDLIDSIAIRGAGAPTTSTVGTVGQLYEDGTNGDLYQLKSIDITVTPNTYNWEEVGGGSGPTVVQTTGTSTTDVMSQNAVTSMVFATPATKRRIVIGDNSTANTDWSITIGNNSTTTGRSATAIGGATNATGIASVCLGVGSRTAGVGSVALGAGASATRNGEMNIGSTDTSYGYNSSNYRLLTGLYDPQSAHDAATKGYVDNAVINGGTTAPTSTTAGVVGTQYTYVDTTGAPTAHLCVCTEIDNTDPSNPVYTWSTLI